MALHELLSLMPQHTVEASRAVWERWTETEGAELDNEPAYARFVDDEGRAIGGSRPARALLSSDDPRHLELTADVEASLADCQVFFVDWGRQALSFEEIFDLWDAWQSQDMIVDCGAVAVSWPLAFRWVAPCWVAFKGDFDGAPLVATRRERVVHPQEPHIDEPTAIAAAVAAPVAPPAESFLARARRLRGAEEPTRVATGEQLPMLPFTLDSLQDASYPWPQGVA